MPPLPRAPSQSVQLPPEVYSYPLAGKVAQPPEDPLLKPQYEEDLEEAEEESEVPATECWPTLAPSICRSLDLSLRCAVCVLFFTVPFLLHDGTSKWVAWAIEKGYIMSSSGLMYMYTICPNTGDTIELAYSAVIGTFLSVFNMWLMVGFFPGGISDETEWYTPWCAAVWGGGLIFLLLLLNFNMNTRIFAITSWVFHWMKFMQPGVDEGFSRGFTLNKDGPMFKELAGAVVGCTVAVLTTLIPRPLWASTNACNTSERLVRVLDMTWKQCISYMCSSKADDFTRDALIKYLGELKTELNSLSDHIKASWWECLGFGRGQQRRVMLSRLHKTLNETYDRLYAVWHICLSEEFGEIHTKVMAMVQPLVEACRREADGLLRCSSQAACEGEITDDVEEELMERITRTQDAIKALTMKFKEAKRSVGQDAISKELLDEHCFCLNVCALGRAACQFAEALLQHKDGTETLPDRGDHADFLFKWDLISDPEHLSFVLRHCLAIYFGMAIGYNGYHMTIQAYSAGIACTSGLLLTKFVGSAATKNVQRIQGVVIGTIAGQLVHAYLGYCNVGAYCVMAAFMGIWLAVTLYIYIHYGNSVFLLLAAFGSKAMMQKCDNGEEDPTVEYHGVVYTCMALFITIAVDAVLAQKPASTMASEAIVESWTYIYNALRGLLDPSNKMTRTHASTFANMISTAEALGKESVHEMSCVKAPWKATLFDKTIETCSQLRMSLCGLEYTASNGVDGGPKDPDVLLAIGLPTFAPIRDHILRKFRTLSEMLAMFAAKHKDKQLDYRAMSSQDANFEQMHNTYFSQVKAQRWESSDESLEKDGTAQVCALLAGLQAIDREMNSLLHTMLG